MAYFLLRENEFAVAKEVTYATAPGVPAAGDFFKHTSSHVGLVPNTAAAYRDRDRDVGQASVTTMFTGRRTQSVTIETDVVPSGVTGTPTAPDVDVQLEAVFGAKHTATAHTTTAAGSTTTTINLAVGGGAASGLQINDFVGIDVSVAFGVEVRQVQNLVGDVLTLDRALSAAPAAARNVYAGTTYRLNQASLISLYLWLFNGINKYAVPGTIFPELDFSLAFTQDVPMGKLRWTGMGRQEIAQTETRPTPTTAGRPLVPSEGKIWFGTTKLPILTCGWNVKNGLELRNNESDMLAPTAVKRTGNNSRYIVESTIEMYLTDSSKTYYDAGRDYTAIDALVQLGSSVGNIWAYRLPSWRPRSERTEQDGENAMRLAGRGMAVSNDDEITIAQI